MAVSEDICSCIAIGKHHRPAHRYMNINMLTGCESTWFCMYFVVAIYQQPLSHCLALVVFMTNAFCCLYRMLCLQSDGLGGGRKNGSGTFLG
jgi:hypothetical protein